MTNNTASADMSRAPAITTMCEGRLSHLLQELAKRKIRILSPPDCSDTVRNDADVIMKRLEKELRKRNADTGYVLIENVNRALMRCGKPFVISFGVCQHIKDVEKEMKVIGATIRILALGSGMRCLKIDECRGRVILQVR